MEGHDGKIMDVDTSGASLATASPEVLSSEDPDGEIMDEDSAGASLDTASSEFVSYDDYYGKIMNVSTTGASLATAKPEGLSYGGVKASQVIAARDLNNMNKYKKKILDVGRKNKVDPAVIAAIISRESHAGTVLKNGWGDHGNAFGLMQVDKRYHKLVGEWDSETHINQGTHILVSDILAIRKTFPRWTKEQQLKGGISAYNAGVGNVRTYDRMGIGTTHNDYANDVVARAKYYKQHGY